MKRILLVPLLLVLGPACVPMVQALNGLDDDTPDTWAYDGQARWQGRDEGTLSGSLSSVGEMQDEPAEVELWIDDGMDVDIRTHKPDGSWAMVAGWVPLDEPLAPGQVLDMTTYGIGCWGPEEGAYDYDGMPESGQVFVDEGADGSLVITVDMGFEDGFATGVAVADPIDG